MKISYNWLKSYVNVDLPVEKVAEILTDTGLEVGGLETYQSIEGGLKGLVVGKVLSTSQHPDADRLKVTSIDVGGEEPLAIVCGAPNVAKDQKVVVATVGTTLYPVEGDSFQIKNAKIRGVASFGMICAQDEIGLGKGHDGIIVLDNSAEVGTPVADVFEVYNDDIIEIDITPNRSDALSHYGVARDLVAALRLKGGQEQLSLPVIDALPTGTSPVLLDVQATKDVPRYAGVVINNVKVEPSPGWLQNALKSIGLSPINNVVDITNFVLHELGHPLHAFDLKEVGETVVVRNAAKNEKFTTLDGVERELSSDDLLIANKDGGMCLAGILGGSVSGVSESTTAIFLESAYFDAVSIRKTARRHGLNTDASFRFERGADIDMVPVALARAANLIVQVCGGQIAGGTLDAYPVELPKKRINLDLEYVNRLVGQTILAEQVELILTSLGIEIEGKNEGQWSLIVPNYKDDVTRPVDVVEEILRIYGYNNIETPTHLSASIPVVKADRNRVLKGQMASELAALGYHEIMSNSLEADGLYAAHSQEEKAALVKVLNPLSSELNIMRFSGVYSGLEAIRFNANRQQKRLQLFEFGYTYAKKENGYEEKPYLGLFISGESNVESWTNGLLKSDFFTAKGMVQHVLVKIGINSDRLQQKVVTSPFALETLTLSLGKNLLAEVASVDGKLLKKLGIDQPVYFGMIHWDTVVKVTGKTPRFQALPKFPAVRRDLALLVDQKVTYQEIAAVVQKSTNDQMRGVNLFDVYTGKNLPESKKSYAISISFRDEQATLTDKKVDKAMQKVVQSLNQQLGAELR